MHTISLRAGTGGARVQRDRGDYGAGMISDVSLVTQGEALGHSLWLDSTFLDEVARGALRASGLKCRFGHPSFFGADAIGSVIGRFQNARRVGVQVKADLHLLKSATDSPVGDLANYILDLAEEAPDFFAASIVFEGNKAAESAFEAKHTSRDGRFISPDPKNVNNYRHARLGQLHGADLVDEPAANPAGIFTTGASTGAVSFLNKGNPSMLNRKVGDNRLGQSLLKLISTAQAARNGRATLAAGSDEHGVYDGSAGGLTVSSPIGELMAGVFARGGGIISRVTQLVIESPSGGVGIPVVDETSRADGSRFGGILVNWKPETAEIELGRARFGLTTLNFKSLAACCAVTDELMRAAPALGRAVKSAIDAEATTKLEDAILNGTTGGPDGILHSPALITVAKETGQATGTIVYANLRKMLARLAPESRGRAIWTMNCETFDALLTATLPAGVLNLDGPLPRLLCHDVLVVDQAPVLGAAGDVALIDFSAYSMITRPSSWEASSHVRFIESEIVLKFVWNIDGAPMWRAAATPMHGTATISPYVALGAREA